MKPYLNMGFPVKVIEAKGAFDNVHGMPVDIVERRSNMKNTMVNKTKGILYKGCN